MEQNFPWNVDSGSLTSPNFPKKYPGNIDKTYKISTSSGPIDISFSHFDVEDYPVDSVTITDGDGTVLLSRATGRSIPSNMTSNTETVFVKFYADRYNFNGNTGWKLNWQGKERKLCKCCD